MFTSHTSRFILTIVVLFSLQTSTLAHHPDEELMKKCEQYRSFMSEIGTNNVNGIDEAWEGIGNILNTVKDNSKIIGKLELSPNTENDNYKLILSSQVEQLIDLAEEQVRATTETYILVIQSLEKCLDGFTH